MCPHVHIRSLPPEAGLKSSVVYNDLPGIAPVSVQFK
jgi:hypothetical protein